MFNTKNLILIAVFALISVGCGTDGLEVNQQQLSFSNAGDIPDEVTVGQSYSFTVAIENGSASDINLTNFTEEGDWLNAQLVNNGAAIELSGTPPSVNFDGYGYSLTAVEAAENNAYATFAITVFPN